MPDSSAQTQQNPVESLPQDFVLYDSPRPRQNPNRSTSRTSQRRHSSYPNHQNLAHQPASLAFNPRVAQLLQANRQSSTSSVNANRITQFYVPSAPSSGATLNQQSCPVKVPVPFFHQDAGSVPPQSGTMMNAADVPLGDLPGFEMGSTTAFSSPVMASGFDFNSSTTSSTPNWGTISPRDLIIHDPLNSAPNSAALTSLTSPSTLDESPGFNDSFDVSPNFGNVDNDPEHWSSYPSLFPQESCAPETSVVDGSAIPKSPNSESPLLASSGGPLADNSPVSALARLSSSSSARKRSKPLSHITVDVDDPVAVKRARNTLAARKSRERKAQRLDELEAHIKQLEEERDYWKQRALAHSAESS